MKYLKSLHSTLNQDQPKRDQLNAPIAYTPSICNCAMQEITLMILQLIPHAAQYESLFSIETLKVFFFNSPFFCFWHTRGQI